jgi:hypothetical protein
VKISRLFGVQHWHWQNLNEKWIAREKHLKSGFWHGRAWWHFKNHCLHTEWHFGQFRFGLSLGFDPSDREILLSIKIPLLISLYIGLDSLDWKWLWKLTRRKGQEYGNEREIGFHIHSGCFWWNFWQDQMESRSTDPWWMHFCFDPQRFLLGRRTHEKVDHKRERIFIPLPEGEYLAEATFQTCTWARQRWPWWPFKRVRDFIEVAVLQWGGLPHEGKGENSWDCGRDGTYGYSVEGHRIEEAIAHGVAICLRDRMRYGGYRRGSYPSPIINKMAGVKAFAMMVARCVRAEEAHPKWEKSDVVLEPLDDKLAFIHHVRDGHPQTITVPVKMAARWEATFNKALKMTPPEKQVVTQATT